MILKIQRPLDGDGPLLIYNRTRSIQVTRPQLPRVMEVMGPRFKVYAEAVLKPGDLHIQQVVADQDW